MDGIREPRQKRSIEKKERILKVGFERFCEVGYYRTNTIEIAKLAGVSTGALYSYFKDKRQIFVEAFDRYLRDCSEELLRRLKAEGARRPLDEFIDEWIAVYTDVYSGAGRALMQLRMMMLEDKEIARHFSETEREYASSLTDCLRTCGAGGGSLLERVYTSCILIDSLRQEKSVFPHEGLSFDELRSQTKKAVLMLLSE